MIPSLPFLLDNKLLNGVQVAWRRRPYNAFIVIIVFKFSPIDYVEKEPIVRVPRHVYTVADFGRPQIERILPGLVFFRVWDHTELRQ